MANEEEYVEIFVKSYYHRGLKRRVFAYEYGLEAFKLKIPKSKYRPSTKVED